MFCNFCNLGIFIFYISCIFLYFVYFYIYTHLEDFSNTLHPMRIPLLASKTPSLLAHMHLQRFGAAFARCERKAFEDPEHVRTHRPCSNTPAMFEHPACFRPLGPQKWILIPKQFWFSFNELIIIHFLLIYNLQNIQFT